MSRSTSLELHEILSSHLFGDSAQPAEPGRSTGIYSKGSFDAIMELMVLSSGNAVFVDIRSDKWSIRSTLALIEEEIGDGVRWCKIIENHLNAQLLPR